MKGRLLLARVVCPSTSSLLTTGTQADPSPPHPFFHQKLSFLQGAQSSQSPREKKRGAGRRRRDGGKKRKSVTPHLAKASDQQQLPNAESLLCLPPGEWLPGSIQQKASFHRNWHKSGVIPSISMELLRIYGSMTQQAESRPLRATSPGFPAGDCAALLLWAVMLTVRQHWCRTVIFPDAVISSRCSASRTFGEITLFHALQENFDNLWAEECLIAWINYFFRFNFFPRFHLML